MALPHNSIPNPFLNVPEELWLEIFYYATIGTCVDDGVNYVPFAAIPFQERDSLRVERRCFATKRNLLLVCKAWNALATETAYRSIRICHGTNTLLDSLYMDTTSSEKAGGGNGRFVRNVEINSRVQDFDPFNPTIVAQILAQCPGMVSLARPFAYDGTNLVICKVRVGDSSQQSSHLQVIPHFPTLSALRRVDWWLPLTMPPRRFDLSSTELFQDLLGDIINHAPNLRYLTLGGPANSFIFSQQPFSSITPILSLHNLTTLRLECDVRFGHSNLTARTWQLPNLTHLLVGGSYSVAIHVIEACGSHLKVLEIIGKSFWRSAPFFHDFLEFLSRASNLEEFNFPLDGFGKNYRPLPPVYPSTLRTIRLKLGDLSPDRLSEPLLDFLKFPHRLPMLKQLVFYDHCQWQEVFQQPTFLLAKQVLEEQSCIIEFA
ncbi:uncharacterized protein LACBIDRAFT_326782 [Laccaria bicolor S238N-H82]|uniref:Predicted protein n=1 Tax=Laccaria bicolor (strain S238N-H82 / ATCC MYA-4686) TaxID=486041 RepID=B0D9N6_LACBS|nr:uncharacterized protein LACBIDRAFT_326782 [Laccaria bicolor S238N-H82]EDR08612.1 predicted protein [Laccaria bicolor S238N-H82]|eukprot:XP_001880837.1 predicted protein [Laccaria bicolor S238N-H82]